MGDIADMMLDGTLCAGCGDYLGKPEGYPQYCYVCAKEMGPCKSTADKRNANRHQCSVCGKWVKATGINDHMRDAHGVTAQGDGT